MRLFHVLLSIALAAMAHPALAAVTLRYVPDEGSGPGNLVIEVDDAGNIRAEGNDGNVMLIRGSEVHLVLPARYNGAVVLLEDALALTAEMRVAVGRQPGPEPSRLVERGPQRVGQWDGTLFWIEPLPPINQRQRSDVVIATDPALAGAGRAFARVADVQVRLFQAAFNAPDNDYSALSRSLFQRGLVLRVSGLNRLESISDAPIPAARFALPGPVLSRDAYRALLRR